MAEFEVDHLLIQVVVARREPVPGLGDRLRKVAHHVSDPTLILADPQAERPYGEPVEQLVAQAEAQARAAWEREQQANTGAAPEQ